MSDHFRLTLCQLNAVVGDLAGNADLAFKGFEAGRAAGADLVALPEMFITGYQIQDLVDKPAFAVDAMNHIRRLAERCADGPALGIGGPLFEDELIFNAYYILKDGRIIAEIRKHHLPNYEVFDEKRLYTSGPIHGPVAVNGLRIGLPICEDGWFPDVAETMVESGAEILLMPNGSPYHRGKLDLRMNHMVSRVVENNVPLIYLNLVGGQDDQMFDGASFVLNPGSAVAAMLPPFEEAIAHVDFQRTGEGWQARPGDRAHQPDEWEQDYRAMVESLRDYVGKSGFSRVLLGLSGGIDSALVATLAADALGPENVRCVMLPSEYTSSHSLEDAAAIAQLLGCHLDTVPIGPGRAAITETLAPVFEGTQTGIAEENIQSRLRGLLLMAISNKFGELLLTTGNKSEVAVGYATIYGDMAGAYNPIKDLYKTRVFETCRWRNANHRDWMKAPDGAVIPERIISKPPSAELRADQKDEDSLPPYEILDGILEMLIEGDASVADCVEAEYARETVKKVEGLLLGSEYKRFQAAPGVRLTQKAFWLDRRYPIVNKWRDPS
ncbi:NAD+ synthase [Halovulum sp. GXIMD14793]